MKASGYPKNWWASLLDEILAKFKQLYHYYMNNNYVYIRTKDQSYPYYTRRLYVLFTEYHVS